MNSNRDRREGRQEYFWEGFRLGYAVYAMALLLRMLLSIFYFLFFSLFIFLFLFYLYLSLLIFINLNISLSFLLSFFPFSPHLPFISTLVRFINSVFLYPCRLASKLYLTFFSSPVQWLSSIHDCKKPFLDSSHCFATQSKESACHGKSPSVFLDPGLSVCIE